MKRLIFLGILSAIFTTGLKAQNEIDALRYSRLNPSGSARFVAMGGAFTALGADFTTLSHNPAGIGLYRSSEISLTPSFTSTTTETNLDGNFREDQRYNFGMGNIGIVLNNNVEMRRPQSAWKNVQFGFGLNRMANFSNRVAIEGDNHNSSYLTSYLHSSQGVHPGDLGKFDEKLAYDTELLFVTDSSNWTYGIDKPDGGVNQRKAISSKGSINEMVLSFGANYNNRLYLGATVGVPSIRYSETATYTEKALPDDNTVFNTMTRTDLLETTGTGLNFKFGMIFRATDWLRIGGAVHTPTFYTSMYDDYTSTMRAKYDNGFTSSAKADGYYEYELTTPMRVMAGASIFFGKAGLLSADYEYVDYTNARLRAGDYDFYNENNAIRDFYRTANNIRLGTEWRYGVLNFRGGYGISANPYKYGTNSALSSYSLGIGIRESSFYLDAAWVYSAMDDEYYLYHGIENVAKSTTKNNSFLITVGIKY